MINSQISDKNKGIKSGFVMIAGAPNSGKSTLLNRMLGQKVSITSEKPQTTRTRILGVLHRPSAQMVFLDTPGVHTARGELNTRMVDAAFSAMADADLILFIADLKKPDPDSENLIIRKLNMKHQPVILGLNKKDGVLPEDILKSIDHWQKIYPFEAIVPVSAKLGHQVEDLIVEMERVLPQGPPYFPDDALTDMPERFIAAEMVREKVFRLTGEEIPHSTAVTVESFSETPELVKIHAVIHLERDSQKGIVIGKGGGKIKQIGEAARKDIERMLGVKVFLKLFVRVQKNWTRDTRALRKFGY
jgi:GTP-binding protein Era